VQVGRLRGHGGFGSGPSSRSIRSAPRRSSPYPARRGDVLGFPTARHRRPPRRSVSDATARGSSTGRHYQAFCLRIKSIGPADQPMILSVHPTAGLRIVGTDPRRPASDTPDEQGAEFPSFFWSSQGISSVRPCANTVTGSNRNLREAGLGDFQQCGPPASPLRFSPRRVRFAVVEARGCGCP